jgi:hypothetical protein
MSDLIQAIAGAMKASREAMRHEGRCYGFYRGVVTDNAPTDPTQIAQRSIKVVVPSLGPTNTNWLQRVNLAPATDPPLPRIGDTVLCGFIAGNPHDGVWFGSLTNLRNPPFEQADPIADNSKTIPGDSMTAVMGNCQDLTIGHREQETQGNFDAIVAGDENRRTEGDYAQSGAKSLQLINDSGCELLHDADGSLRHIDRLGAGLFAHKGMMVLLDKFGNRLTLGGRGGVVAGKIAALPENRVESHFNTDFVLDLNGHALHIVNASDVTINGKSVIVVNSIDTGGDVNADRGY